MGCQGHRYGTGYNQGVTDSITAVLYDLMSSKPSEALAMVDSLEREGIYGEGLANCRRAQIYSEQYQPRVSGIYAQRALKDKKLRPGQRYFAYNLLINSAMNVGNTKRALEYATEALNATKRDTTHDAREYAPDFMVCIAGCQMKLNHHKEGNANYEQAYLMYEEILRNAKSFSWFYPEMMLCVDAISENANIGDYTTAHHWLPRLQRSYLRTTTTNDIPLHVKGDCTAEVEMVQAKLFLREGKRQEAERHYQAFLQTDFAQSPYGHKTAAAYLEMAGRWKELEQAVAYADSFYRDNASYHTMDYLSQVLARRFKSQRRLGHHAEALNTAATLISLLDSVEERTEKNNAAELAVIYETQEKEQKIADQQSSLSQQRWLATACTLLLLSIFFVVYTLYRRKAHRKLQRAYDQLEETTTAKERIESELRIARNIQMSMVPQEFPQRPGLDLYALMIPAREVGGDLYSYVLHDDELYFCVGDVSGKGVPASLYMSQATRMFHALASQHLKPADIAAKMSDELAQGNEQGMFITMFIGLLQLSTGHLDYCNCGHTSPILGCGTEQGHFLEMESNVPIGLWPGIQFVGEQIESIKGQTLFVYTDGLNEAEDSDHNQFGDERLLQCLSHTVPVSSQKLTEYVLQQIEQHRQDAEPNDDLTMLCLRIE